MRFPLSAPALCALSIACLFVLSSVAEGQFIRPVTPLAKARAFHGSAVVGDFVYIIGGATTEAHINQEETGSVHGARMDQFGNLSRWVDMAPIPAPRLYIANSTVVVTDTIYIVGGSNKVAQGDRYSTTLYAKPDSNGLITRWMESAPFAESGFSCSTAFSTPGHLHVAGGLAKAGGATAAVWTVPLMENGSLGAWEPAPELPSQLWFHHSAVVGSRAYIWGGIPHGEETTPVRPGQSIFSAPILGSGKLGRWKTEDIVLPRGFYSAASAVAGPYLFSFSPRYGYEMFTDEVWWAVVNPGGMTPWKPQVTGIDSQVYHAVATDYARGNIYVTGGKSETSVVPQNSSYLFSLSPQARQMAEQAWMTQEEANRASISTMDAAVQVTSAQGAASSFVSLEEARLRLQFGDQKPLVLYFGIEGTMPCREQDSILDAAAVEKIQQYAVVAQIDARAEPQTAQQFGIIRVPTWVFYDQQEEEKKRALGVQKVDEIIQHIQEAAGK